MNQSSSINRAEKENQKKNCFQSTRASEVRGAPRGRTEERSRATSADVSTRASIDDVQSRRSSSRVADFRRRVACVPTHSDGSTRLDSTRPTVHEPRKVSVERVQKNEKPERALALVESVARSILTPVGFEPTLFRKGMFHPRAREKS